MSELRLISLVSLLCLGLAACSDDKKNGPDDPKYSSTPMTVTELCALDKASLVERESSCATKIYELDPDEDSCAAGGESLRWAEALAESVTAGRLSVDWAKARQCTAEARALRASMSPIALATSAEWAALMNGTCASFYAPLVETNGACRYLWDCKNETDFCTQDAPYGDEEGFTCKPRAIVGEQCDGQFRLCQKDLVCASGICAAETLPCADSDDCAPDSTCAAGACVRPGSVALGGVCSDGINCAGECVTCSQHAGEATSTCKQLLARDAACETADDCAVGLGCTGGVCTTVPEGADCDVEDRCDDGSSCERPVNCTPLNETDCNTNAPYCRFEAGSCRFAAGRCVVRPTSGACLPDYSAGRCASGLVCVTSDTTCRPLALENQPCDSTSVTAPPCALDFVCSSGTCTTVCGGAAGCPTGQYCNTSLPTPACEAVADDVCTNDAMCGTGKLCPQASYVCSLHADATTCGADVDCSWDGSACVAGAAPQRHCAALRKSGEVALAQCVTPPDSQLAQNNTCESGFCTTAVASGPPICAVVPRGCLSFSELSGISLPFAFGMFRVLRRRKR